MEDNIRNIIRWIGEDPDREGLIETPHRVLKSYAELFAGYHQDPASILKTFTDGVCDEMVVLRDIEFWSCCEHHMLPFFGRAHIAYLPNGKIVGLSKLARLLEVYSRRLQVQERLTTQVTKALDDHLQALGSACVIEAKHLCLAGDSLVQLAFLNRRRHPNGVPIKDLVGLESLPIYCYDRTEKRIVVGRTGRVWCSGTKRVYRVTYEWFCNNQHRKIRREGSIKVTGDHPFMLRKRRYNHYNNKDRDYEDGFFLSLDEGLGVGDSLMPFTCYGPPYSTLFLNNGRSVQEHRFLLGIKMGRELTPEEVCHHRNGDPMDNSFDNLELIPSKGEHSRGHLKGKRRPKTNRPAWNRKERSRLICENCQSEFTVPLAYMEKTRKFCSRDCYLEALRTNHRIIRIEEVGEEKVYDLEVPGHRNFAVNDVIVHNCMICRGIQKQQSVMITSSLTGEFRDPAVRAEFFHLIKC